MCIICNDLVAECLTVSDQNFYKYLNFNKEMYVVSIIFTDQIKKSV